MNSKGKLTTDTEILSADSIPHSALRTPHSKTVLIVEDSPVQAELLRRALEGAGYNVIAAANGAEGLAMVKANHPTAVVSDINMPVMDGYAMCQAIRREASLNPMPIILLTMLSEPEDLIRGLNAGADGYLTKPYNISALASRLESLLAHPPEPPPKEERRRVEVRLGGETYLVDAHGPRMLNLLISTYQNAVLQNHTLTETQAALEELNQHLEHRVREETAELRTSESRYRSLFENMLNGFAHCRMIYDAAGRPVDFVYLDVNRAFERISGLTNVIGKPVSVVIPGIRKASPELFEAYGRVASTGNPEIFEFDFKSQDQWYKLAVYRPAQGEFVAVFDDITERKRAEEELKIHVAKLEAAFMSTVGVATSLSGMRDPYTAGHERRVAEIAVAIGAALGFDATRQEGLRVAGLLHDVGKITLPAEILSKPGKLTPIEFQLIQEHARASYEVLKDVQFPWPVAEVALQHHERLDGSGYPQGLKGDAILLEARIVAVADVVEAMTSYRPYRPGLGIDKALAEIERGRGSLYDTVAADTCLKLFREQGYTIPD